MTGLVPARRFAPGLALLLSIVMVGACHRAPATAPALDRGVEPGTLLLSPDSAATTPGTPVQLTAHVYDGRGYPLRRAWVTWMTTDTSVIRVDARGLVTPVRPGVGFVVAASGTLTAYVRVTVAAPTSTRGP